MDGILFSCSVLENNIETQEETDLLEQMYIKKYSSIENGYNISDGGQRSINNIGRPVLKINLETGKILEEYETVAIAAFQNNLKESNIRKVCYGKTCSAGGFLWQYKDSPNKIKKQNRTKKVVMLNSDIVIKEFESSFKAAEYLISIGKSNKGISVVACSITACCKKRQISAYGFCWEYC